MLFQRSGCLGLSDLPEGSVEAGLERLSSLVASLVHRSNASSAGSRRHRGGRRRRAVEAAQQVYISTGATVLCRDPRRRGAAAT